MVKIYEEVLLNANKMVKKNEEMLCYCMFENGGNFMLVKWLKIVLYYISFLFSG